MENERLLAKIEELMKQRGYSRYRLSQLSGIKQSTLTTMFNKRSTVSIDTLTKISKAFGMKCSEFLKPGRRHPGRAYRQRFSGMRMGGTEQGPQACGGFDDASFKR